MTRDETIFQIGYSIRLEKMQAMLLARFDRFINFSLMLLGAAVITTMFPPVVTGIAVAVLGGLSFIYQPGVKSILALTQKQKYENLRARAAHLSDDELLACYAELQESDSQAIGSLAHPAHMGELIRLGQPVDFDLGRLEAIMAFIAGDLPKPPRIDQKTRPE
jgi:hypothetical protein